MISHAGRFRSRQAAAVPYEMSHSLQDDALTNAILGEFLALGRSSMNNPRIRGEKGLLEVNQPSPTEDQVTICWQQSARMKKTIGRTMEKSFCQGSFG